MKATSHSVCFRPARVLWSGSSALLPSIRLRPCVRVRALRSHCDHDQWSQTAPAAGDSLAIRDRDRESPPPEPHRRFGTVELSPSATPPLFCRFRSAGGRPGYLGDHPTLSPILCGAARPQRTRSASPSRYRAQPRACSRCHFEWRQRSGGDIKRPQNTTQSTGRSVSSVLLQSSDCVDCGVRLLSQIRYGESADHALARNDFGKIFRCSQALCRLPCQQLTDFLVLPQMGKRHEPVAEIHGGAVPAGGA